MGRSRDSEDGETEDSGSRRVQKRQRHEAAASVAGRATFVHSGDVHAILGQGSNGSWDVK